jgi:ribosomal protein S12 methylthiotransferase
LLRNLSDVDGIEWIRLHYAFPTGFPMDALDVMKERNNICNYLDIPLQHGSSKMLQLMRRGTSREKTETLLSAIRDKVPDIAIRTTFIVGHPGETEKDYNELIDFMQQSKFERAGVFQYSHEENTHSHSMQDDVPSETKQARADELMAIQESISFAINQKRIGQTIKVLVDRKEGSQFIGRSEHDSPEVDNEVIIESRDSYLRIGDFVNVKITDASEFDLHGVVEI